MGRITSSIGLVTGVPIAETIEKLLEVSARPRDLIKSRSASLSTQQVAVSQLTARVLGVQFAGERLGEVDVFDAKSASSSNSGAISASVTGSPTAGSYQFTSLRVAQSHQLISKGVSSADIALGGGSLSVGFGGYVDSAIDLSELNGGDGFERGKIKITDRSGASATIDLRYAQTVDDILQAVNENDSIDVTASAHGDSFRLVDNTGQTTANLQVEEVSGGTTAASLGLAAIDTATNSATGSDILSLHNTATLDSLRGGVGLSLRGALDDLEVTLRDGTSLKIDFHRLGQDEANAKDTTVAANGVDAQIDFQAKTKGSEFDGVRVQFVNSGGVTKGSETVVYDDTDPNNKTLTFDIEAGQTNANDIAAALAAHGTLSDEFSAIVDSGGDGTGLITLTDTAVLLGGAELEAREETTLGQLIETINETDPTRLSAKISDDGNRLELTDLTTDNGGTFAVTSPVSGTLAEELGLTGTAVGGVLTGERLQDGLKTSLLSSLNGGSSLGTLGTIQLTDRSGATASVDLATAETLDDALQAINDANVGITASINNARNGIELTDTTGASASNLIVANADGTNSADLLQVAVDDAVTSINSGSLHKQLIGNATTLESLNGGQGVSRGSFIITNSEGVESTISLTTSNSKTIADVIDTINVQATGVEARLNDAGNGILLSDTTGSDQAFTVRESGSGSTARDLHLLGSSVEVDVNGTPTQQRDGSFHTEFTLESDETLEDLVEKINESASGFRASVLQDGSTARLSLTSEVSGQVGALLLDEGNLGLQFNTTTKAQDAQVLLGAADSQGTTIVANSSTNTFTGLIEGVSLKVKEANESPVTITIRDTDDSLIRNVKSFVDAFNLLRDDINTFTKFDETNDTTGVLFGSNEVLRVESEFSSLLTKRFFGAGKVQGLDELGISLTDSGKLSLDEEKLKSRYANDPEAISEFFTKEESGFVASLTISADSLAGENSSLLLSRTQALQRKIDVNQQRIDSMNERLDRQRERLLIDFTNMELVIGKLKNNLTAIGEIKALPSLIAQ